MNTSTNGTQKLDTFDEALSKNLTVVICGLFILYINGTLVRIYFRVPSFRQDARYALYIHLVLNDMLLVSTSVLLHVLSYQPGFIHVPLCYILLTITTTSFRTTPIILAGMAVERFVAVCLPLHHSRLCTTNRVQVFNALAWCITITPSFTELLLSLSQRPPQFYRSDILCYYTNLFNSPIQHIIRTTGNSICMAFVWVTLFYTYAHVLWTARAAASSKKGQAQKAQRTILLHGAQLLLCMLSYVTPAVDLLVARFPLWRTKVLFGNFILTSLFPRVLSPLIYGLRDQAFRKHIKRTLLCREPTASTKVHN